jgi:hypothetical protein
MRSKEFLERFNGVKIEIPYRNSFWSIALPFYSLVFYGILTEQWGRHITVANFAVSAVFAIRAESLSHLILGELRCY